MRSLPPETWPAGRSGRHQRCRRVLGGLAAGALVCVTALALPVGAQNGDPPPSPDPTTAPTTAPPPTPPPPPPVPTTEAPPPTSMAPPPLPPVPVVPAPVVPPAVVVEPVEVPEVSTTAPASPVGRELRVSEGLADGVLPDPGMLEPDAVEGRPVGYSSTARVRVVAAGLGVLALAGAGLGVAYWRHTRPGTAAGRGPRGHGSPDDRTPEPATGPGDATLVGLAGSPVDTATGVATGEPAPSGGVVESTAGRDRPAFGRPGDLPGG